MSFFRRPPASSTSTGTPGTSPLAAPPAPRAERLDRNKLSILAAFAGMGVIAMVIFIQPSPPNGASRAEAPPTQTGTYLDQPVRGAVPPTMPTSQGGPGAAVPYGVSARVPAAGYGAAAEAGQAPAAAQPTAETGLAPGYGPLPPTPEPYPQPGTYAGASYPGPAGSGYGAPATPRPPTAAELRAAAYRRALDASPTGEAPPAAVGDRAGAAVPLTDAGPAGEVSDGEGAAGGAPAAGAAPGGAVTRADQFMQTAALASGQRTVQALTVQAAPGPFSVQAGTVIPAVLMTEINSDLPGECLAQITRDVYDSRAQRFLLIPRGAKLLCRYDDQLTTGQSRLLVAWTRILLPDGRSVSLPGLPATDAAGARGVSDQVDRHAKRAFGTAAALSLIGAGVQLSQPQRGSVFAPPSAGQVMAGALGQELNQVAVEMQCESSCSGPD